jgi:pimeloyl-ACP methyl ester carboxylesterase
LMRPRPADRAAAVEGSVAASQITGSPDYPTPVAELRRRAAAAFDRSYRPAGFARQYAAIVASADRTPALAQLTTRTLVIHGEADPLVTVSGGRATAAAIPGARLLVVPGMGHDLPRQLWPELIDAIVDNARP